MRKIDTFKSTMLNNSFSDYQTQCQITKSQILTEIFLQRLSNRDNPIEIFPKRDTPGFKPIKKKLNKELQIVHQNLEKELIQYRKVRPQMAYLNGIVDMSADLE